MALINGIEDDVNPNNIAKSVTGVGGYLDGIYAWAVQALMAFPSPLKTFYEVLGRPGVSGAWINAIDCEPGNPTPTQAAQWLYDELDRYGRPDSGIYVMSSWYSAAVGACYALGIPLAQQRFQVAHYDNIPLLPPGALMKQYASFANYDISVADPAWYGRLYPEAAVTAPVPLPAPAPPPPVVTPTGKTLAAHIVNLSSIDEGYWLCAGDGGVFSVNHPFEGSEGGKLLAKPVVDIIAHGTDGYWLVAADGGVFNFGSAEFHGSAAILPLSAPVMAGAAAPDGNGYWLVGADGGVFNYGSARFFGSTANVHLFAGIVDIMPRPQGDGYWLVGGDGGVFSFGNAGFHGSAGNERLFKPVVSGAATPTGEGYWLFAADGGVFNFGDAGFFGSGVTETAADGGWPVVAGESSRDGQGYTLATANGAIYCFGDAVFEGTL
jgi:hypothetical protein